MVQHFHPLGNCFILNMKDLGKKKIIIQGVTVELNLRLQCLCNNLANMPQVKMVLEALGVHLFYHILPLHC